MFGVSFLYAKLIVAYFKSLVKQKIKENASFFSKLAFRGRVINNSEYKRIKNERKIF